VFAGIRHIHHAELIAQVKESLLGNIVPNAQAPYRDFLGLGFTQDTHDMLIGKSLFIEFLLDNS
jgi:hypothetical protein